MRGLLKTLARVVAGATVGAVALRWLELRKKDFGSTPEERRLPLPGDEFIHELASETTNAITIDAPPRAVWPWLIQMGYDRAGWYSFDLLDRGGVPSAREIIPEFQDIEAGYVLAVDRAGSAGFPVLRVDENESLVFGTPVDTTTREPLAMPGHGQTLTWSFHLEPLAEDQTRLIVRVRGGDAAGRSIARVPAALVFDAIHPVMQAKQLQSIKERAEQAYRSASPGVEV
jgi:proline iminopeptidase